MFKLTGVKKGDKLIVAISGGKDSMCLIDALLKLKNELSLELKAVNVDHKIRGEDSKSDSLFVKDYCEKAGVPLLFYEADVPTYCKKTGAGLEQGARILRYAAFNEAMSKNDGFKIATAHHLNDNFESVLFNEFRGTGLKGLRGVSANGSKFVRPLITCSRKDIDDYVELNRVPFVVDKTNFDETYSRNYIRSVLTPLILSKFPHALDAVRALSEIAREEDEFLDELAKKHLKTEPYKAIIDSSAPNVLFKRAAFIAFKHLGFATDYTRAHLESLSNLRSLKSGSTITLPQGIIAANEYGKITIYKSAPKKRADEFPFKIGEVKIGDSVIKISDKKMVGGLKFDGDKIPPAAVIRTRRDGDTFKKFGGGTKKLKDYLIDKKIPKLKRDELVLVASDKTVLMILGVEISDLIKVDETTKTVYYSTILKVK